MQMLLVKLRFSLYSCSVWVGVTCVISKDLWIPML